MSARLRQEMAGYLGCLPEDAEAICDAQNDGATVWVNDIYQVTTRDVGHLGAFPLVHMAIRRRDGEPIFRDWRHFQQIKNEIVGPQPASPPE